ncbi:hypothetical protein FOS14_01655 [Skermania sp. ID1734]|uniref:YciI family protein n=1 Tax=Skermania sp. ID1734 TaxID=2597516 RepID=UPI00117F9931|nr:YciI family protein [Skermania sp. ID1734]TSE02113.1 hypothetical protein FOS14_01655 [Skermania sp. ID1734]
MTQYLLSVWGTEGAAAPSNEEMQQTYAAVDKFNAKLREIGAWVFAGGLHDVSTATVVDGTGDDVVTTDGPFAESKEFLGGFWVIEAPNLDRAIELAAEGSAACRGKVEVRPFADEPA